MSVSPSEFIDSMMDSKMLGISHVDKPLLTPPAVTMNHRFQFCMTLITFRRLGLRASWDNFSIAQQPLRWKMPMIIVLAPAPRPLLPRILFGPKLGFINLNFTSKRTMTLSLRGQSGTNCRKDIVNIPYAYTHQSRAVGGRQIYGKTSNQVSESLFSIQERL